MEGPAQDIAPTCLPVLCFGDSLTAGYHGVWQHPTFGPTNQGANELIDSDRVRYHPYAARLGARLAQDAGQPPAVDAALRFAECRAYSGWTALDLLPKLRAELAMPGRWRAVVILAGSNDVLLAGRTAAEALTHVGALHAACDDAKVPVVVIVNSGVDIAHFTPVPAEKKEAAAKAMVELSEGVAARAAEEGRAVVDARVLLPVDDAHAELWDDSLHYSPAGSQKLGDAVYEVLKAAGL